LKKAAEDHPDDANAHKSYAVALYASGDPAAARVEYEKVVRLSPKDALAYNNLGNIYRDLHETDKAIAAYKKAIDLNPRSVNTYANLASVQQHNQERIDEAIATYQQGLKVLPDDSQLQLLLGLAYEANHDTTRAVQTYKNILTHDPGNTAAKANLTRVTASSR
jgi:tetratricopeptide (TPR) repeat protein